MRVIPKRLVKKIEKDPFMKHCIREAVFEDHECSGRITWEHSLIYAGRQINERWAIIPLCEKAHFEILDKKISEFIALNRATEEDFAKYPNRDWIKMRKLINRKFESKYLNKLKEVIDFCRELLDN